MAVDIRHATAADREALADLFHDMDRHYWGDKAPSPEEWCRFLDSVVLPTKNSCEILIAEQEGDPVGVATFAIVYPARDLTGQVFMKDLYTRAGKRGQGVGRRIMSHIARLAVERGCSRFDWTTESHNARAMSFYASLGASAVGEKVYYRLDGEALSNLASESHGQ